MLNFYVDESGNSGNNLFDAAQPFLYYGVMSSSINVELLGKDAVEGMRRRLGVAALHANELGLGRLAMLGPALEALCKKLDLRFDFYWLKKIDYAFIQFFDQVFDQGLNKAMPWFSYWSPMRYLLLVRLATITSEDIAERAWRARTNPNEAEASRELAELCRELRERVSELPDQRTRQIVYDALSWAIEKTETLSYGTNSKQETLWISPNVIGFQWVLRGIGNRISARKPAPKGITITVDQQSQFNRGQRSLAEFYASVRDGPFMIGPGLPEIDFSKMPTAPLTFESSKRSYGLELVDLFLWIMKKVHQGDRLPIELKPLVQILMRRGRTDCLSIQAIVDRWEPHFREVNKRDFTHEEMAKAHAMVAMDEERRRSAMAEHGIARYGEST